MKKSTAFILPMAFAAMTGATSAARADIFVKIADIPGDSTTVGHEGEIDVLAWSWQLSNSGTAPTGGGGGGAKVTVRPIVIEKEIDSSTPLLYSKIFKGERLPEAVLSVTKPGKDGFDYEYISVEMKDVIISGASPGGDDNSQAGAKETLSLTFGAVCIEYIPDLKAAGIKTCWDIVNNKAY